MLLEQNTDMRGENISELTPINIKQLVNREYDENKLPIHFEYVMRSKVLEENYMSPKRFVYDKIDRKAWAVYVIINDRLYRCVFTTPSDVMPLETIAKRGMAHLKSMFIEEINKLSIIDMLSTECLGGI